ncbi:isopentenyl-diphosphate Delta-isomerase [Kineococcus rhizosphaerae]|uniref:Isopentenyl-diphosphate Delta-isomerase n=1 Tax=Kineococcus rhizosphaerae TaxID=559628 RepID=A0A2T0R1I3_9ACTN|nr:isopentenyl-diphosphate Delta-isomerase [Kineococcus rhizosphaerae]PRY13412.1 isopentenyl-diphosphate delta-isomerase [Kineococcus rhizosphaerae]
MTLAPADPTAQTGVELVVLLTDDGTPCGTAPKADVHHTSTPLHLAFSCWIFDAEGRTLLTRRAAVKRTWPGAWTNSFCGHPGPGEEPADAVTRRAVQELGAPVAGVEPLLPSFRYRAVMDDGIVENEICPVFSARLDGDLVPDPDEVDAVRWVGLDELRAEVAADPSPFSPWMLLQLRGF